MHHRKLSLICAFLLLAGLPQLRAETVIAVHPIQGEPAETAAEFFDVIVRALPLVPGEYAFRVYTIDMSNLPPGIPDGGFAAFVPPSPLVTAGAPYAITGEIQADAVFPGSHRLRLYLWNMEDRNLLTTDTVTAENRWSLEQQSPDFLAWLLRDTNRGPLPHDPEYLAHLRGRNERLAEENSRLREEVERLQGAVVQEFFVPPITRDSAGDDLRLYEGLLRGEGNWSRWLYLGLRVGAGLSQWYYGSGGGEARSHNILEMTGISAASLQVKLHLMRFLGIQTEVQIATDFAPVAVVIDGEVERTGNFSSWFLTVPIMARLWLQEGNVKAGLFGGVYFTVPLGDSCLELSGSAFQYRPAQPGFVFGLDIGRRLGPGWLFLDCRFTIDRSSSEMIYRRNVIAASLGYRLSLSGFAREN